MELISTLLIQVLATFTANFLLLLLIGIQAKRAEEKQREEVLKYQERLLEEHRKRGENLRRYVEMES